MYSSVFNNNVFSPDDINSTKTFTKRRNGNNSVRNIKDEALVLHISNTNSVLSVELVDTNTVMSLRYDSLLIFSQWKPKEYAEIRILSDGQLAPDLTINEYDIQNSVITYTKP